MSECRIHLLFYFTLQILVFTQQTNGLQSDQMTIDNIQTENDDEKFTDEFSQDRNLMNIFGTYPALTDISRDNLRNSTKNSEAPKFELQTEPHFLADDMRVKAREKKALADNEEYKNIYHSQYPIDMVQNNNKFDGSRAVINEFPNNYMAPLLDLCKSSETYTIAACLTFVTWARNSGYIYNDRRRVCANAPSWSEFRRCLHSQFNYDLDDKFMDFASTNKLFNAWGKRNNNSGNIPKRIPFHSWGGKRFSQVGTEKIQASRVPFNAWGGKRQYFDSDSSLDRESQEPCKRSKLKFHSWGGKRSE